MINDIRIFLRETEIDGQTTELVYRGSWTVDGKRKRTKFRITHGGFKSIVWWLKVNPSPQYSRWIRVDAQDQRKALETIFAHERWDPELILAHEYEWIRSLARGYIFYNSA